MEEINKQKLKNLPEYCLQRNPKKPSKINEKISN
jgi:hypothetical protein